MTSSQEPDPRTSEIAGIVPMLVDSATTLDISRMAGGWEANLYLVAGSRSAMVVRTFSGSSGPAKADREASVILGLDALDYPVPKVYGTNLSLQTAFGGPYIVMELVPGEPLMTPKSPPSIEAVRECARMMVELHSLDATSYRNAIDGDSNARPRRPSRLDAWARSGQADLRELSLWIRANTESTRESVCHGDFHPGNVMWSSERGAVVIDWTAASIGDSRHDLAWSVVLAGAHLGEPARDATVAAYAAAGGATSGLDPFEVAACARRLSDLSDSLRGGAEAAGMRSEALEMMKSVAPAYRWVATRLQSIYGKAVPSLFEPVEELSR